MSEARLPRKAGARRSRVGGEGSHRSAAAPTRLDQADHSSPDAFVALRERDQQLLGLAMQAGRFVCWDYDPDSGLDWLGRELGRLHGLMSDNAGPDARGPVPSVHPADKRLIENMFRAATARDERVECEIRLVCGNDDEKWISVCVARRTKSNRYPEFVGISRDITERRQNSGQQDSASTGQMLSRELNHRLRNVFPMILTIVKHTAVRHPQATEYRHALEQRLRALAAATGLIDRSEADSASIEDLIRLELAPFQEGANILITGPIVEIQGALARDFAILVHELATNAVKHGALSNAGGKLSVTWGLRPDTKGKLSLALEWIERDGPKVEPPKNPGFGTMVISESGSLLGGAASIEYAPEGLRYRLSLPAERLRGSTDR
jgi:two-component sensor histidine kinase